MAKKIIRTGTTADPTGDSLKNAFVKVNENFTELYNALGLDADLLNLGAFEFTGSVMTTTDSSAIVIDQATTITSNLSVGGDILPQTANGGDLGSSTLPWRSLYVSNNTIYIGGTAVGLDANGNLTTGGTVVGSTPAWANITGKPTFATVATTGAYADLTGKPTIPTLVSQLSNDSGFLTSVSNIQSESDVSIQVNLTDSTIRIWRFGEDGDTVFPTNISINYSGGNVQYPRIIADSGKAFSIQGQGNSGSTALAWTVDPDAASQYAAVSVSRAGGDNLAKVVLQAQSNSGDAGTAKTWRFNETGTLTLPAGGVIADAASYIKLTPAGGANEYQALLIYPTAGDGNHIHLAAPSGGTTELYLGNDLHFVKLESDGNIRIQADNGVNGAAWTFGTDGSLQIPGDIRSEGNINIDINLADSTLRRWSFGEDGSLTLPSVGKINNGAYDWTFGTDGELALPNNGKITSGVDAAQVGSTTTIALSDLGTDQANNNINVAINWTGNEAVFTTYAAGSTITFANGDVRTITEIQKNEVYGEPGVYAIDIYWSTGTPRENLTAFPITLKTSNYVAAYTAPEWQFGTNGVLTLPGILKIDDGVHEKFQTKADATGVVTHDCSSGHIFRHTSPDANWTANFTNLNLDSTYATSVTLIIAQGATGYYPSAVQIAGSAQTINWQGNVNPTVSTSRTDVVTFSIINNSGTYTVLGQLTGF